MDYSEIDKAGLAKLYHFSTKITTDADLIPFDRSVWPESWKKIYYKEYPRLPKVTLPQPEMEMVDYFELTQKRTTEKEYTPTPLSLTDISALLRYSCGITKTLENGDTRRVQPSGGARYPLEVYPVVFNDADELPSGVYHYAPNTHELDVLWRHRFTDEETRGYFTYDWARQAPMAIFITAVFERNLIKYSEKGYRHIMLEAGHIGQGVYLTAKALNLKCAAIAGVVDRKVEELLDIDGDKEALVYCLMIGK